MLPAVTRSEPPITGDASTELQGAAAVARDPDVDFDELQVSPAPVPVVPCMPREPMSLEWTMFEEVARHEGPG